MGLFSSLLSKLVPERFQDKKKLAMSNIAVGVCLLLIALNVGVFIFLPKILSSLALILSNAITVLLMFLAVRPINRILQAALKKSLQESEDKEQENAVLRTKNLALSSQLNTFAQMANAQTTLTPTAELLTRKYTKEGYLVKEIPVKDLLADPAFKLKEPEGVGAAVRDTLKKWADGLFGSGDKRVLFIEKQQERKRLGIDLQKVRFALSGDSMYIYGLTVSPLINEKTEPSDQDIERCWMVSYDRKGNASITTEDRYSEILKQYADRCRSEARFEVTAEIENTCRKETLRLQDRLSQEVSGLVFVDAMDNSLGAWLPLLGGQTNPRLVPLISSITLICNLLNDFETATPPDLCLPACSGGR